MTATDTQANGRGRRRATRVAVSSLVSGFMVCALLAAGAAAGRSARSDSVVAQEEHLILLPTILQRFDLAQMSVGLTNEVQHQVVTGDAQTRFGVIRGHRQYAFDQALCIVYRHPGIRLERLAGLGCLHRL